jgi:hypothetical protein
MRSCNLDAKKTMNSLMNCCSSWLAWLFCYTNLKMQCFTVNNGATSFPVRGSFIWLLCNATESGIIFLHTLHAKPPCIIELISHLINVTKLQNSCVVIVNIIGHKGGKHCVSILDDFGSKWDSTPTLLRHSLCGCVVHGVKWLVREGWALSIPWMSQLLMGAPSWFVVLSSLGYVLQGVSQLVIWWDWDGN